MIRRNWPSVTQVLSVYSDFSKIRPDILERAAERGSEVHRACAAIAQGLFVGETPQEIEGYVASFRRWFENVDAAMNDLEDHEIKTFVVSRVVKGNYQKPFWEKEE